MWREIQLFGVAGELARRSARKRAGYTGIRGNAIATANGMKSKALKDCSAHGLDRMALDQSDVKPMSAAMRRKWEAAQQTGKRMTKRTHVGKSRKTSTAKSRIVPVSLDPTLLSDADRYARSAGISRSHLVAESLRLRMSQAIK